MLEGLIGNGKKVQVLTRQQIESLYKGCNNQEQMALIIGLNSGINRDELLRIIKMDVNLDAGTINIRGDKKSRMVYVTPAAMRRLKSCLIKLNGSVDSIIQYNEKDFKAIYQRWTASCGFDISWQNIRHTYAELAAQEGLPVKLVAHNIGVEEKTLNGHFDLTPQRISVLLKDKVIA